MAKTIRRLSSITALRGSQPTSPDLARNFMNFRFNHLNQRNVRPTKLGCADDWTTPNAGGRPQTSANAYTGQALDESYGFRGPTNDPGNVKV